MEGGLSLESKSNLVSRLFRRLVDEKVEAEVEALDVAFLAEMQLLV